MRPPLKTTNYLTPAALTILSLGLVSCEGTGAVQPTPVSSACVQLSELVEQCLGVKAEPSGCDEDQAVKWSSLSCESLTMRLRDDKSDFSMNFNAMACDWGLYAHCPPAECDGDLDEPEPLLSPTELATPSPCAARALTFEGCEACQYYACREEDAQCGEAGYLMRYAHHYCNRFRLVTEPHVSGQGQLWLRKIRRCLIESLDEAAPPGSDCETIAEVGFGSHPGCYAETGFCALPVSDWVAIINTIERGDLSFRESILTGQRCLEDWLGFGSNCAPLCTDRTCGPDGCGGSCGVCPDGVTCSEAGVCEADDTASTPPLTSCEGRCGAAPAEQECFCDNSCFSFGDCCPDYEESCL